MFIVLPCHIYIQRYKYGKKFVAKNVRMSVCVCGKRRKFFIHSVRNNEFLPSFSPSHFHMELWPPPLPLPPTSFPPFLFFCISRRRALWGWGSVMVTMVPGGRYVCSTHAREDDSTNDREERILAVLGIIGTVLNLLVVIFVYIYTSVT